MVSQLSNLVLCLSVTLKLFKQYKHKTVVMRFLAHSFIATIFLFAGMYTLTAWILPNAFVGGIMEHHDSKVIQKLLSVMSNADLLCFLNSVLIFLIEKNPLYLWNTWLD